MTSPQCANISTSINPTSKGKNISTIAIKKTHGFTIVELLIVIVVIGILAAISIVAYSGIQERARTTKIKTDISQLTRAIVAARTLSGKALTQITSSGDTASDCVYKASGTDLALLPKSDTCWVRYLNVLNTVSDASGAQVRNLTDPWGRPYFIDENENENNGGGCTKDSIGVYQRPHQYNNWAPDNETRVSNSLQSCP